MNKTEAGVVRREIQEAIKPILESHGLALTSCNARFDDTTFNLTVKSSDPTAPLDKWELQVVGLPDKTPAGTVFRYGNRTYTLTGINLRARKFPINATRDDGKQFKLPESAATAIREALGKEDDD